MNRFSLFYLKHRIRTSAPLKSCMILMAFVMIPVVVALVFSQSMMNGITEKYICLSDGHIRTGMMPGESEIIYSCDKTLSGFAMVYSKTGSAQLGIKGVEDSFFNVRRSAQIELSVGQKKSNLRQITLSRTTADTLGVSLGDKVALMIVSGAGESSARPVLVTVGSIYSTGYEAFDSMIAFTSFENASEWFDSEDSVYEILLEKDFGNDSKKAAGIIGLESYSGWEYANPMLYTNFSTSRQMIMTILILVSVMAAFYTAMVSNQLVSQDMRNIAITRLLGMKCSAVVGNSVLCVMCVTVLGILLGLCMGLGISFCLGPLLTLLSRTPITGLSNYLLDFEVVIPWLDILVVFSVMLALSLVSVILSLQKTRRISPMQLFTEL